MNKLDTSIIVNVQPINSCPNHILHSETILSFKEVPDELNKHRDIHYNDSLSSEIFEADIPMYVATSLQDELQRALHH